MPAVPLLVLLGHVLGSKPTTLPPHATRPHHHARCCWCINTNRSTHPTHALPPTPNHHTSTSCGTGAATPHKPHHVLCMTQHSHLWLNQALHLDPQHTSVATHVFLDHLLVCALGHAHHNHCHRFEGMRPACVAALFHPVWPGAGAPVLVVELVCPTTRLAPML